MGGNLRTYLVGMADDTHLSTLGILEVRESYHDEVERVAVKVAKALVDEERTDDQVLI